MSSTLQVHVYGVSTKPATGEIVGKWNEIVADRSIHYESTDRDSEDFSNLRYPSVHRAFSKIPSRNATS